MRASLNFNLPDDDYEFQAALLGQKAICALWDIDHRCRSLIKHGDASDDSVLLAEQIRSMIPDAMLEVHP